MSGYETDSEDELDQIDEELILKLQQDEDETNFHFWTFHFNCTRTLSE